MLTLEGKRKECLTHSTQGFEFPVSTKLINKMEVKTKTEAGVQMQSWIEKEFLQESIDKAKELGFKTKLVDTSNFQLVELSKDSGEPIELKQVSQAFAAIRGEEMPEEYYNNL